MADNPTHIRPVEIYGLADRLTGYSKFPVFNTLHKIKKDIKLAARILRHLLEKGIINTAIDLDEGNGNG